MPVSLSSGLSSTLAQLGVQQSLNNQYFQNANSFIDLGTRLDFMDQFAQARQAGLSPTQALLGIQQTAINPQTSNLGLQNFSAQSAQLAPFAIGAAQQGNPLLLNQLNASIGAPQLTGALQGQDVLQAFAPFAGRQGPAALIQQQQNDRFLEQSGALTDALAQIAALAQPRNDAILDIQRFGLRNQVTPNPIDINPNQNQRGVVDVQNILGFAPTTSSNATNGFVSPFGFAF